ncbi:hypothetical protein WA026_003077 [Henosepilachna vigintioctopunctata]|uniref:Uncharacterized protein n=1 Tax=Henosepilachna vigintioctopunctata TaxID=420089 RepID=A0AAW1TLC2_9CUCU
MCLSRCVVSKTVKLSIFRNFSYSVQCEMGCTVGCTNADPSLLMYSVEEEEDTWISGEELKTEGSSGSEDDVPRRKVISRKSRRRRSEGYTPPEARFSLPNLGDNKTGIAFQLTLPNESVIRPSVSEGANLKPERFSVGGGETERANLEVAMARMRTRSSLDATPDLDECLKRESEWRPKRGSLKLPNLEEGTPAV